MLTNKLFKTAIFLLLISSTAIAQNYLNQPESVAYDTLNDRYLVTNVGNGYIVAIDHNGNQSIPFTVPASAVGNHIDNNILYVSGAASPTVYSFDLTADTLLSSFTCGGVTSIDGITTDTSGFVYTIARYATGSALYRQNITSGVVEMVVSGLPERGQDIVFDKVNNKILSVYYRGLAPIVTIDLSDLTVETVVAETVGSIDGVTIDNDGFVYISASQENNIYKYDTTFSGVLEIIPTNPSWPTGLDYNFEEDLLAIPLFSSNSLQLLPVKYSIECDSSFGHIPFTANFIGISSLDVSSWRWDFGDGTFSELQSPSHTYNEIGYYDVTMTVVTSSGDTARRVFEGITALADSIFIDTTFGEPLSPVEVLVYGHNTIPVNTIKIPVEYDGNLNLRFDSISTVGCRTEYYEEKKLNYYDGANERLAIRLQPSLDGTQPDLPPGEGLLLKICFTITANASPGRTNPVLFEGFIANYTEYFPTFNGSDFIYSPIANNSVVMISIPPCCVGIRGNINNDPTDQCDISDLLFLVDFMFLPSGSADEPECTEEANVDGLGEQPDISDLLFLVDYMFLPPGSADLPAACP